MRTGDMTCMSEMEVQNSGIVDLFSAQRIMIRTVPVILQGISAAAGIRVASWRPRAVNSFTTPAHLVGETDAHMN